MKISDETWNRYISKLRKVNDKAAQEMSSYLANNEWNRSNAARRAAVQYAYALATKYGEAATEAACEMYDAVATAWAGEILPPAEPAPTASYAEVRKTFYGAAKTNNPEVIADATGRLVKQAGVDTTLKNGIRDGAQFAWVPRGETCAFCIMLASRGWQNISKKALKNGHAEHIHANCDCTYAVRFSEDQDVEGYEPEKYLRMYNDADPSGKPSDKLNAMRRSFYAANKAETTGPAAEEFNVSKAARLFTPAKSIKEAEEFAAQYTQGGSFSTVDYSGIDLGYANEFNRALDDVLSQYDPQYKLRNIGPMNMRSKQFKGTTADAAYRWGANDLYYNKGYFKTPKAYASHLAEYEKLLKTVLPNIDTVIERTKGKTGFGVQKQLRYMEALKTTRRTNASNLDPYRTMVHEIGHYLDDTVFRGEMKKRGFDLSASAAEYAGKISAYATESAQEYVAESFLMYWTGEEKALDPKLVEIFRGTRK